MKDLQERPFGGRIRVFVTAAGEWALVSPGHTGRPFRPSFPAAFASGLNPAAAQLCRIAATASGDWICPLVLPSGLSGLLASAICGLGRWPASFVPRPAKEA